MKKNSILWTFAVFVLAVALVVSLFWTAMSIRPAPEAEVQELTLSIVPEYTITTRLNSTLWPSGTELPQGLAGYFYAAGPSIRLSPVFTVGGLGDAVLSGTTSGEVVVQSTDDQGNVYWTYQIQTLRETAIDMSAIGADGNMSLGDLTLDAAQAYERATGINEEMGFQPTKVQLVAIGRVYLEGIAFGKAVTRELTYTLPIQLEQKRFTAPKTQDLTVEAKITSRDVQEADRSWFNIFMNNWIPFTADFALLFALIELINKRTAKKTIAAREHKKYKEWITEGTVDLKNRLSIQILSLEGIVDLAIDLDKRVIYDPKLRKYYVLEEDLVYLHDPEGPGPVGENRPQLGKILLDRNLLSKEQLETGLYYHQRVGSRLGESLVALGFIDETTLYSTLAAQQKFDYYDLNSRHDRTDAWDGRMTLQMAKALQILPLGERSDGKVVVACVEPQRESVQNAVRESFGEHVHLVATKPSAIYEQLELAESSEWTKSRSENESGAVSEVLTAGERDEFTAAYFRGTLRYKPFIKALGHTDQALFAFAPEEDTLLQWLVSQHALDIEYVSLLHGLEHAIDALSRKERSAKQVPALTDLLEKAAYLTPETVEWVVKEAADHSKTVEEVLVENFLSSSCTINAATEILKTLEQILTKQTSTDGRGV